MDLEPASFSFHFDRTRSLLTICFAGLWTVETVKEYAVARRTSMKSCGVPSSQLLLLVDRRSQPVQTQDVSRALQLVIADNASFALRTAVLVNNSLHRLQVERTVPSSSNRSFLDEAEALRWLRDG